MNISSVIARLDIYVPEDINLKSVLDDHECEFASQDAEHLINDMVELIQ